MHWRQLSTLCFLFFPLLFSCSTGRQNPFSVDGERAYEHVREIVSHGPHPPGSEAQEQVSQYIAQTLSGFGIETEVQSFEVATPRGRVQMRNVKGEIPASSSSVILLASHYDSKYFRTLSFVGANDGGASSGLLLELARVLEHDNPTTHTLWFVFFDGEEAFEHWTNVDSLYGSREFVRSLKRKGRLEQISAMILLDLIGGQDLSLKMDTNSTQWLSEIIWRKAREMGHQSIFQTTGMTSAEDDHFPFAQAGIPVVDVIDLSYPFWHRQEDTLDKVSPANMEIVGNVILRSLPLISAHLNRSPSDQQ